MAIFVTWNVSREIKRRDSDLATDWTVEESCFESWDGKGGGGGSVRFPVLQIVEQGPGPH